MSICTLSFKRYIPTLFYVTLPLLSSVTELLNLNKMVTLYCKINNTVILLFGLHRKISIHEYSSFSNPQLQMMQFIERTLVPK